MPESEVALSGMKVISEYVRRSPSTVLSWIRELGFPARKIGGIWESDKELIDQWRKDQIRAQTLTGRAR
jgi:hypothetical protein